MKKSFFIMVVIFLMVSCTPKKQVPEKDELTIKQDQRMEWWREARFGMFIHWGLYALPAGEWNGEKVPGISEWIMLRAKIPVSEYEQLANGFNPVKFNAEEWVQLAKNAGMKYIVITSKHHDGFAMFHSLSSKYNIVDATPFDRDPLKELADACKKHGIRLGFYYSQAQDWHEPGGTYSGIDRGQPHWDPTLKRDSLMNYIKGKAVPQVKEILENYGGLDILWWDTPIGMTEEAASLLQAEVDKYPDMLTNNRLYRPWPGDFSTPEQHVPPTGLDYDWEVCMTMNTSWGYKWYDNDWKSSETLIRMLADIASKGGNLLLNVGPTAEGIIPDSSVVRLKQIGQWMSKNGESIYGTSASPFFKLPWGRCTMKSMERNTLLYLHVFDWPTDGILRVPGIKAKVNDVYHLPNPKQKFAWKFEKGDLLINTPAVIFDPVNTVMVVKISGDMEITSNMPALKNGVIRMPADFADIHNPGYGTHARLEGKDDMARITNWSDHRARLEWMFNCEEPGLFQVEALISSAGTSKLMIKSGDQQINTDIRNSGNEVIRVVLGELQISSKGNQTIELIPVQEGWTGLDLSGIELVKK